MVFIIRSSNEIIEVILNVLIVINWLGWMAKKYENRTSMPPM